MHVSSGCDRRLSMLLGESPGVGAYLAQALGFPIGDLTVDMVAPKWWARLCKSLRSISMRGLPYREIRMQQNTPGWSESRGSWGLVPRPLQKPPSRGLEGSGGEGGGTKVWGLHLRKA